MVRVDTSPDNEVRGNEADQNNVAQKITDNKFKHVPQGVIDAMAAELSAAEQGGGSDGYGGSLDDASPEERREAIQNSEAAGQDGNSYSGGSQSNSPYQGNDLKSRLLRLRGVKGKGATTGIAATVFFIGGILLSMASGSSFWAALEKNLTNDAADDSRINTELHRAFNSLFKQSCGKATSLSCKMKTMTKEQVQKWKDAFAKVKGTVVDDKGNPTRGSPDEAVNPEDMKEGERLQATEIDLKDGFQAKTIDQLNGHLQESISMRDMVTRAFNPVADDFIKGKFGKMLTDKYKISKAKATPEEQKTNNAQEEAKTAADKATESAKGSFKQKLLKAATSPTAQLLQTGVDFACMGYNATRIAVGAVKAKWALDLIRFAYPFVRLAAKIQDGSATEVDFQQIEDKFTQLVDYMSNTRAAELENAINHDSLNDVDKRELKEFGIKLDDKPDAAAKQKAIDQIEEIKNKNAFDSMGLQDAIYGNTAKLTDFTKQFSTGIVGTATLTADFVIKKLQGFATLGMGSVNTGKQNIKSFCKANKALGNIMMAGGLGEAGFDIINCFAAVGTVGVDVPSDLDCVKRIAIIGGKMAAYTAGMELAGSLISAAIVASILKQAPELPSDALRGPAAGDAIAAGIGLLLAHKAQGSGLKPAMSVAAVNTYISSTQQHYDEYHDQLAYYDARDTPFDTSNRYSFLGQIVSAVHPSAAIQGQQTSIFSSMANLVGIVSQAFSNTANALHSEPSLMTDTQAHLAARTNNGDCAPDEEKQQIGMMCDTATGRTIQVSSPRVLQWAKEDASGKTDHLTEAINWMQQKQPADQAEDDGGTQDETCKGIMSKITSLMTGDWGSISKCEDSGDTASIDDKGAPVKGSQYEKFVNYCTDKRQLEMGSTDIDQGTGSAKEQAWHDGTQCGLTYDSNGNPSTSDKFDKSKDTGKGSLMMDYFTYYYNMCNVQYATQNGATDCTNDKPPDGGSSSSAAAPGGGTIAETAKEMGNWGGQYQACYATGGGHGDTADLKKRIDAHFAGMENGVDCSGFARAVIFQATGKDPGSMTTDSMCADTSKFEHVPRGSAQPGDFAIDCTSHVEVITAVNGGTFQTVGSHTTGCGPGNGPSPGNFQGNGEYVLRYKGA